jgi:hypothetical protein
MKLSINITLDNAAYYTQDDSLNANEIYRNLQDIARRIESGLRSGNVRDYNGNTIGHWAIDRFICLRYGRD